jgi:hypothetical protein
VEFQRLQTFRVLSETQPLRHAAQRLGITQSAANQQIAAAAGAVLAGVTADMLGVPAAVWLVAVRMRETRAARGAP